MTRYLRCIKSGLGITVGKRYRIVGKEDDCYVILDDAGERHLFPIEIDDEYESYRDWFVLETEGGESMENVIEVDGVKYREVKRKAAVGEKIKTTRVGGAYTPIPIGEILVVTYVFNDGSGVDTENWPYEHEEYVVLEPITEYPRVDIDAERELVDLIVLQRELNGLKQQQAELTKQVSDLATQVDGLTDAFAKLAAKTAVPQVKSTIPPQVLRDDIVKQAKLDVAELIRIGQDVNSELPKESPLYDSFYNVKFEVNREKRTVVALILYNHVNKVRGRGIAKCAPGDVFNSHIGRAIALRRALGLDVPTEYTNAPQPEGVRVGDVLTFSLDDRDGWYGVVTYEVLSLNDTESNLRILTDYTSYPRIGSYANGGNLRKSISPLVIYDDSRESIVGEVFA